MFDRPPTTYKITRKGVKGALNDTSGPLYQVVNTIEAGSTVLDVGAGNGLLSMMFQETKKDIVIDGVEPNKSAAKIAKPYYRKFYVGYVQDYLKTIKNDTYDYIVLADVIEHIVDPEAFLRELISLAGKNTKIVVSTPNIAFASVRLSLLEGEFDYKNSGILEKTHLRFFTRNTLEQMINNLDIGVESVKFLQRRFDHTEIPVYLRKNPILIYRLLKDDLASTYQFFFVLSASSGTNTFDDRENIGTTLRPWNIVRGH